MKDCIALIGSTGFFEVFEVCPMDWQFSYYHLPTANYHWSDWKQHGEGQVLHIQKAQCLTTMGMKIVDDPRIRDLVRTVERL